jgi:hypothetical protein
MDVSKSNVSKNFCIRSADTRRAPRFSGDALTIKPRIAPLTKFFVRYLRPI